MIAAGNAPAADYAGRVILVVDHRDSFTYNLVQLIERLGHPTEVVATDAEPAEALAARRPDAVVLSPGPGSPAGAAVFLDLLAARPLRAAGRARGDGLRLRDALPAPFGGAFAR